MRTLPARPSTPAWADRIPRLGLGLGWRPALALFIDRRHDLGFVEIMAEDFDPDSTLPPALQSLRARGLQIIPHGVTLSLGSAEPPDPARLARLARLAERVDAPCVSEHLAFVRSGSQEAGHLLPVARTRASLEIVVENVRQAQAALPVPLAVENIAGLFEWPDPEFGEADFLAEVVTRADVGLLLDLQNVFANACNLGFDPRAYLDRLPWERIAYMHVAGGHERHGIYHDTHTDPVPLAVLDLLAELHRRGPAPGVMLERDGQFPAEAELHAELDSIAAAFAGKPAHVH